MTTITINHGFGKYEYEKQDSFGCTKKYEISVLEIQGLYSLHIKIRTYDSYGDWKSTQDFWKVENKKRLSTINKYAEQYGVQFEK